MSGVPVSRRALLRRLYSTHSTARQLAEDAGLDATCIPYDPVLDVYWGNILTEAGDQRRLVMLFTLAAQRYPAYRDELLLPAEPEDSTGQKEGVSLKVLRAVAGRTLCSRQELLIELGLTEDELQNALSELFASDYIRGTTTSYFCTQAGRDFLRFGKAA